METEESTPLQKQRTARAAQILAMCSRMPLIDSSDRDGACVFISCYTVLSPDNALALASVCLAAASPDLTRRDLAELLIQKNERYGDSALKPIRHFSKADPGEQLRVRMDDKLSRIRNGDESSDVWIDLAGYAVLYALYLQDEDKEAKPRYRCPECGALCYAFMKRR